MYFVITLDVKVSKAIDNRDALQVSLKDLCAILNTYDSVVSKFDIILGDEIQGLIKANHSLMNLLIDIYHHQVSYGFKLHIGIGYGNVNTAIDFYEVEKNDGSAFHLARQAVVNSKKKNYPSIVIENIEFKSIQDLINLYFKMLNTLSPHALDIKVLLEKELSQTSIAEKMNTKQSSISRTISRYSINEILQLKNAIENYLIIFLKEG